MYGEPQFSGRDKSGCSCAHIISQQPPRPNGAAAEPQEGPLKSVPGSIHVASASFSQAMLTLFAQFQRGLGGRPRPASPGWVEPSGAGPRHFIIFLPRVPLAKNRISVPRKSGNYLSKGVRYRSRKNLLLGLPDPTSRRRPAEAPAKAPNRGEPSSGDPGASSQHPVKTRNPVAAGRGGERGGQTWTEHGTGARLDARLL